MKRNGPPEPAVKSGFAYKTFGIEVSRADFILLLRYLEEKRREEEAEKQLNIEMRRARGEAEKSRRRASMEAIARYKAQDRVVRYGDPFLLLRTFPKRRWAIRNHLEQKKQF